MNHQGKFMSSSKVHLRVLIRLSFYLHDEFHLFRYPDGLIQPGPKFFSTSLIVSPNSLPLLNYFFILINVTVPQWVRLTGAVRLVSSSWAICHSLGSHNNFILS